MPEETAASPKIKTRKPKQRACDEKDEKGKLCNGHLKRYYDYPRKWRRSSVRKRRFTAANSAGRCTAPIPRSSRRAIRCATRVCDSAAIEACRAAERMDLRLERCHAAGNSRRHTRANE